MATSTFPHPVVFCVPAVRIPLELGTGAGSQKTRMMGLPGDKEVWQYLQPCGYNAPTWQTDRQTDGHRATAKTALTHVASRSKYYSPGLYRIRWKGDT